MLDNMSSGKRLPEKSLLVLGGLCLLTGVTGPELTPHQAELQRHSATSSNRYRQRMQTIADRQTEAGSRQSRTSLRWDTRTKTS